MGDTPGIIKKRGGEKNFFFSKTPTERGQRPAWDLPSVTRPYAISLWLHFYIIIVVIINARVHIYIFIYARVCINKKNTSRDITVVSRARDTNTKFDISTVIVFIFRFFHAPTWCVYAMIMHVHNSRALFRTNQYTFYGDKNIKN